MTDTLADEIFIKPVNYDYCIANTKKGSQCCNKPLLDNIYCGIHLKKNHKYNKPEECPICFESLNNTNIPLSCGHWVHKKCILNWKDQCPICRTTIKLTDKEYKKIHKNTNNITTSDDNIINTILLYEINNENDPDNREFVLFVENDNAITDMLLQQIMENIITDEI